MYRIQLFALADCRYLCFCLVSLFANQRNEIETHSRGALKRLFFDTTTAWGELRVVIFDVDINTLSAKCHSGFSSILSFAANSKAKSAQLFRNKKFTALSIVVSNSDANPW